MLHGKKEAEKSEKLAKNTFKRILQEKILREKSIMISYQKI